VLQLNSPFICKTSIFFTYTIVLQTLPWNPEDNTLKHLVQSINNLTPRTTASLQWIPSHTGIHGNEVADQRAEKDNKKQQPKSKLSNREA